MQSETEHGTLSKEELTSNISLLFAAGHETTVNLLGNALKFTETGGKVCIALQPDIDNTGFLQVQISDTGCGIPQNALKTIFDKFRRIDSGQETERGTGLGLSIAKHIVMAHGGKIWATSQPGNGSVFCFTLPVV